MKLDRFQTIVIDAINKRRNCSLRNNVMVWNSSHTGNEFTSEIRVNDALICTVFYTHSRDDLTRNLYGGTLTYNNFDHDAHTDEYAFIKAIENDTWEIDRIEFDEDAIEDTLGSNAVRYRNLIKKHYNVTD